MKIINSVIQVAEKKIESPMIPTKNHDIADLSKLKTHLSYHCTCMNQNETSWFQKKTNGYHSCLRVCLWLLKQLHNITAEIGTENFRMNQKKKRFDYGMRITR